MLRNATAYSWSTATFVEIRRGGLFVPLDYLPIMNANRAGAPRMVVSSQQTGWTPAPARLGSARVALLTSAAVRHVSQPAFERTSDASYRAVPFEVDASELRMDHRSPIGSDARTDLQIVVPRDALAELAQQGLVGSIAPVFFSFVGGTEVQQQVEEQLAPALAREMQALGVDLAILVPY
jgi:D-proline reductase (dithiol) PrdB